MLVYTVACCYTHPSSNFHAQLANYSLLAVAAQRTSKTSIRLVLAHVESEHGRPSASTRLKGQDTTRPGQEEMQ